jgi:hypothetical protein
LCDKQHLVYLLFDDLSDDNFLFPAPYIQRISFPLKSSKLPTKDLPQMAPVLLISPMNAHQIKSKLEMSFFVNIGLRAKLRDRVIEEELPLFARMGRAILSLMDTVEVEVACSMIGFSSSSTL